MCYLNPFNPGGRYDLLDALSLLSLRRDTSLGQPDAIGSIVRERIGGAARDHANDYCPKHLPNPSAEPHAMEPMLSVLLHPRSRPLGEPKRDPERDQQAQGASRSWVVAPPATHLDEGRLDVGDTWSNYDQNNGPKPSPEGAQVDQKVSTQKKNSYSFLMSIYIRDQPPSLAFAMIKTREPRARRAIIRNFTTDIAWASFILAAVVLAAQLVLIIFEGVQQIVATSSQRTQAEVSKSWCMWLTNYPSDPIGCYVFYCAFLVLTTFCGSHFKAFGFWMLQLITLATLSFSLHQDRLLWEKTWSKAIGSICFSVFRILAAAFVANLPSWSWSYMGLYEDRATHPVSGKIIYIQMPSFEIRIRTPKNYFGRLGLALMDIRIILLRLAYIQLFEHLIRFAHVRNNRLNESSAASYELVKLVTIVLGVQALHFSVVRLTTHVVYFYYEKEDRVTPRRRIFSRLIDVDTMHIQTIELDILLGRSKDNGADEAGTERVEVKAESKEDATKDDGCEESKGSVEVVQIKRNTSKDVLDVDKTVGDVV
ncbi:hypothetical protein HBH56_080350 [Parastagonospora nodorum]|nr:hypothetical protein HBH56_080350 [Parastagonospora nodorum]KAH3929905.1 hypothetical protein HBH54_121470 [Parastagonospora nodorum]KAH4007287.1 hypothetical protein HBI10_006190 [Parastagonospora nodorum]KAH4023442.1 hypothetical protein HBI13_087900 [Parastagonospora nodorum]KAH4138397.1 hypothetical protein HBH45_115190 [Parastagonospora nodorum]